MAARGASPDCRERSDQSLKVADPRAVTLTAWPKVPVLHIEYSANYGARIQKSRAWLYPRRPKNAGRWCLGADSAKSTNSMTSEKWDTKSSHMIIMLSDASVPPLSDQLGRQMAT